ncbi:unnamed protein product [Caenorhabditis angaria]|uniref:FAS1 domain-containing protein n=1 Tax=Caenorhabditis angaria TaxID=860376 RepID=A0A9P1IAX6_9PELO|nr:unnamed protein product [Caenorhabditis angaria]
MKLNNLQGPHICVKEITSSENIENDFEMSMMCNRYRDTSVCTSKSPSGKNNKKNSIFYNISRADAPNNSTLLFTQIEDKSFILPGIQNVFEWNDKQIIETSEKEKFVVRQNTNEITEIYLNCALKKETIRTENSEILKFDGILKPAADNLLAIISQNPELSTFYKVLGEDLQTFLREINSATVFAFTNRAFDELPEQTRKQILEADKNDCIQEIMKQHITTAGSYCSNLPKHVKSLYGTNMSIRKNESTLMIEDAEIIDSSGFALNGVVHIIDRVLVRENFLSWRDTLRLFNSDLAEKLEKTNITLPVTIFVPPTAENETKIENPQNYLVSNRLISNFASIGNFVTDANSTIFTGPSDDASSKLFSIRIGMNDFSSSKNGRVGCSKFSASSIYSCKAIIHFLDKPLPIVTKTVEEYIESRDDLNMFAKIWKKSNISVDSTSRITVFAPTNDAFSANVLKKILKNQKSAESFVNRHIVKSILCASDVEKSENEVRSTMYTSIGGQILTPTYDEGQVGINDSKIQEIELVQSNGVVHILESFIEPTSKTSNKSGRIPTNQIIRSPLSIFSHLFDEDDAKVREILGSFSLDELPGRSSSRRVPIEKEEKDENPMQNVVQTLEKATGLFGQFIESDKLPFPFTLLSTFKTHLGDVRNKLQQMSSGEKKDDDDEDDGSLFSISSIHRKMNNLEGPHVCVKEITLKEKMENLNLECDRYQDALVCNSKSRSGKITKRIQYCCDGYTTDDIKENGCNIEISDELLSSYNISQSDVPYNSTLLFTQIEDKNQSYILPGIQNVFEWNDKQIIETSEKEKFVVRQNTNEITEIYLNCALKKETIRMENSQILRFDGDLKPAADNLLEIISQNPELSTFYKVLGEDLQKFLKETKSATVFAFTNDAFDELPETTKKQILSADKNDCIQEIMKQHITTAGSYCSNLPKHVKSLYGTNMSIRKNESTLMIEDAEIIDSSGFALNGVVHIIDRVLVRENFLSWQDTLKVFNSDLAEKLEKTNITLPVTIFVPPATENETKIENPLNYLVSNRLISKFNSIGNFVTDANSTIFTGSSSEDNDSSSLFSIRIRSKDSSSSDNVRVGCSKFTPPSSIYSCKAIIHFLDKPLPIVTKTVQEYIESRDDLNMFAKIWKKSNISFNSTSRITVFAPTNDAFSATIFKKIMKTRKTAESFVNRHIVKSILCESDIEKSKKEIRTTSYTSIERQILTPTYDEGQFAINDANIQEIELVQSNGVIHILESFIEPTSKTSNKSGKDEMIGNPFSIFSQFAPNSKSSSNSGMPGNPFGLIQFLG